MTDTQEITYTPRILRSMAEICVEMGVGEQMVLSWVSAGAPIAVEGAKNRRRYSAEAAALQLWRLKHQ